METEKTNFWTESLWSGLISYLNGNPSMLSRVRARSFEDPARRKEVIDFITETVGLSFSETLLRMVDIRGMTDVEVYKAAKIDRRVFSKIRSNIDYQPSRKTAIRLCLALRLSLSEALALLEKAGLCLSYSKKEDLVVIYCLDHDIFDVDVVNDAIVRLGLEGLF